MKDIPIPKEINYLWFGPTFNRFERMPIHETVKKNPSHTIRLWLDDFSMLEMHGDYGLSTILSPSTFAAYERRLKEGIDLSNINATFQMLISAQQEYQHFIETYEVPPNLAPIVKKFRDYLLYANLPVELRLLSSRFYKIELMALESGNPGPEIELLKWTFLERYRGNYGAASNLFRIQLLISWPGIYLDHDDMAPSFGDLTGFRYTRSAEHNATNCFLASAPGHYFLPYLRTAVLANYSALAANNFFCGQHNYLQLQPPSDPSDLDSPYVAETQSLSGPIAFGNALRSFVRENPALEAEIKNGWMKVIGIKYSAVKTWALSPLGFERMCAEVVSHVARPLRGTADG